MNKYICKIVVIYNRYKLEKKFVYLCSFCTFAEQNNNIMTLTAGQQVVTNDLIKFIQFKNIKINSPEDLDSAFRDFLKKGSVAHFYLQVADDHQKLQFTKQIDRKSTEIN